MTIGSVILLIVMLLVAAVLVTGIALMARGGEANRKYGNKLMAARVALQALALALLALLFFISDK